VRTGAERQRELAHGQVAGCLFSQAFRPHVTT
jgi:hypothetical protein